MNRWARGRARLRDYVNQIKLERGCEMCGYNDKVENLQWHHVIPETKYKAIAEIVIDNKNNEEDRSDYTHLGKLLGLEFSSNSSLSMTDGTLFTAGKGGDAYLGLINMARVRGVSLEQQFSDTNDRRMTFQQAKVVEQALHDYKKTMKKRDFVDMIQDFIDQGEGPILDLLIVDEAQDLVPMQWDTVKGNAKNIREWEKILRDAGGLSRTEAKIGAKALSESLNQRDAEDKQSLADLILKVANKLKESGYLFWKEGSGWSISPNVLNGIEVWNKICKNQQLPISEWKNFSKITQPHVFTKHGRKALTSLDPEKLYSIEHMGDCLNVSAETHWNQVVKVSDKELTYINSVRKSGEKIWNGSPRLKVSTIHKAKGGEADNVLLMLESSRACAESPDQDSEIRTFYVGATGVKLARLAETMEHDDSWTDIIGYAALGGEIINHEKETSV